MKIIGVTKCPTGIAHTYMAAARIEKECERLGYEVKVETQGSQGTENKLTKREIAKADYVIIAADVVIEEPERFYGKWVLKTRIKPLLKNTQGVFERLEQDSFIMGGASFQNENNQNRNENSGNIENFQNKNAKDKNAENTEDKNIENREKNGDAVKQNITYQNAINRSRIVENTQENQKTEKIVGKGYRQELENEQSIAGNNKAKQSDKNNKNKIVKTKKEKKQEKEPKDLSDIDIIGQLMNGASYMIPFVVVGGLLVSLSVSMGADGTVVYIGLWNKIHAIGNLAFTLMYPILSGFIAFSIAGRATLAPAMIGAMVATDGEILGTEGGTGFIGCIIVGYLVGYLVKWMNSWNLAKEFKPMMPIFIIPLTGVAVVSALFIFVLGKPVTLITDLLNSLLVELAKNPSSAVVLGIVLGAMVGIDMGGPINKVAFFFGVTSIAQGNLQIMGIVSTSIAVAPLSMGIAAVVGKDKFTPEEKSAGIYTIFMGIIGISEGAIPFAASDPGHVLPAVVAGSALTGAAAAVCGVTSAVPHGGLVVALFKATNYMSLYFLCVMAGTALSIAIVLVFKRRQEKNR
uniref:fructose-specific PTS transporter subunit EIIC n=1 Tax=Anaerobutyricum hallii TaxID=39488 RepID=UPI003FF09298